MVKGGVSLQKVLSLIGAFYAGVHRVARALALEILVKHYRPSTYVHCSDCRLLYYYQNNYVCIYSETMSVESPASHFYSSPWPVGSVKSGQSSQTQIRSVSDVTEGPPLKKPKIEGRYIFICIL